MTGQYLQFLLVPDSSAARRIRRAVVENGARRGVVIGTWPELVEYACRAYLTPRTDGNWEEQLHTALGEMADAFWAESFSVSPQETSAAIDAALAQVVSASNPIATFSILDYRDLPERQRQHLEDLVRLAEMLEGKLPPDLSVVRDLIMADAADAIQHIFVYYVEDIPALTRWQGLLIEKLNGDAKISSDSHLAAKLNEILTGTEGPNVDNGLATLQAQLFSPPTGRIALDQSVQWLGARDFLEEAEVAAGMVQTMLEEHADLKPADIGLLLPESFEYSVAIDDAFTLAGLSLSGLPVERWRRDLGREAGIETKDALRERLWLAEDAVVASKLSPKGEDDYTETGSETGQTGGSERGRFTEAVEGNGNAGTTVPPRDGNAGAFISYTAVHPEDEETDPDGLAHENRMALEEQAIKFILESEPGWQRTPANNPGFDLFRSDQQGQTEFCKVKAMTKTLHDRPVGMSCTQFDHAYRHRELFWLYVVEHAGNRRDMRIVRIQDPAGKARTFTYDRGRRAIDTSK